VSAVAVRPETTADRGAVRAVVAAAFAEERVVELLDGLRGSAAWLGLSLVAEADGAVVGHVSLTRGWVDAPREIVEVQVLSPLSVRPGHQGRGVGGALVEAALAAAAEHGEPAVFLEGSPRYYSRFGFVAGESMGFSAPSVRIPGPAFQVHPLPSYQPWMRGALVYPDVFWRHDSVGLREPPA
jgi:putative acetyltransferase